MSAEASGPHEVYKENWYDALEVVEATVLGVDPDRDRDLTYEVRRIVRQGKLPARGTEEGGASVAKIDDLANWEPL